MKKITILFGVFILATQLAFAGGYKVGDKATDFRLKNVDGKTVSLSDYPDAKGFVVIFTCNHCPFSVAYEDRIIAIDQKYKGLGYPVIAINPNDSTVAPADSYSKMIVRAEEKGFTFPYLIDDNQQMTLTYGATRTPHVFLLEKTGDDLIVRYIGAIDYNHEFPEKVTKNYLTNAIDALLEGKTPDPGFTKAIGCTVKFAKKQRD